MNADLPPPPPAHVIIIQADDLGIDDLGHRGNPWAHTPNLDRLADSSLQAVDFTVNAVCAPSRATLLTGRHFLRTGVHHVNGGKEFLHREERTLADAFRAAGWKTGIWGKWHLGDTEPYLPWNRGFDQAYAARKYRHGQAEGHLNGEPVSHDNWADTVMVTYAIKFLETHKNSPTLLYLPSMTPHTPLKAPERWVRFHTQRGLTGELAVLYGMVSHLDEEVGRLIAYLERSGQLENTLFIFTSDNGPAINRAQLTDQERAIRKCSARRGWKGDLWENGVRAPLLIHWPAELKPGITAKPLDQVDLAPTILDWCSVPWPANYPEQDGQSWGPDPGRMRHPEGEPRSFVNAAHPGWITNERPWTPEGLPGEYNPVTPEEKAAMGLNSLPLSIRHGRFKLLFNPFPPERNSPGEYLLIDLMEDPGETTDVSLEHPGVVKQLRGELTRWVEEIQQAPHAFSPVFHRLVGSSPTRIAAFQPATLEGRVRNTVHDLRNWSKPGDQAGYRIEVPRAHAGAWHLEWETPVPDSWNLTLRIGKHPAVKPGERMKLPAGVHTLKLLLESTDAALRTPITLQGLTWVPIHNPNPEP